MVILRSELASDASVRFSQDFTPARRCPSLLVMYFKDAMHQGWQWRELAMQMGWIDEREFYLRFGMSMKEPARRVRSTTTTWSQHRTFETFPGLCSLQHSSITHGVRGSIFPAGPASHPPCPTPTMTLTTSQSLCHRTMARVSRGVACHASVDTPLRLPSSVA